MPAPRHLTLFFFALALAGCLAEAAPPVDAGAPIEAQQQKSAREQAAVHALTAEDYLQAGRMADAESEFRAAHSIDPGWHDVVFSLAVIYQAEGRDRDALDAFRAYLPFAQESESGDLKQRIATLEVKEKEEARVKQAGETRPDPKSGLVLAFIPAGSFSMGCASGDSQCENGEKPAHPETVVAFWMDVTDVTVAAYRKCESSGGCTAPSFPGHWRGPTSPSRPGGADCTYPRKADHPVNCVDWNQAVAFCSWAGGRLPTAVEWEYAAKSGRDVIYPWGDDQPDASRAKYGSSSGGTDPVGGHPSGDTPWGLKDMAGNVYQWMADHHSGNKELRGASWRSNPQALRASARSWPVPGDGSEGIGFRCVQ